MKAILLLAVALFLTAFSAASVFAQAVGPQASNAGKIGLVVSYAFGDEKNGITKFVAAEKALNAEFLPIDTELKTMNTKLETLLADIEKIRELAKTNPKAVDEKAAQAKVDEAEKLQRDMKFKADNAKIAYEKRQQAIMGPVMQDIYKSLQDYTKLRGYVMLLDAAKLEETGILIGVGDDKVDVTKDFITYYNTKPATTASATPK
jgi:Skp family chaperone for outer membrane proteins